MSFRLSICIAHGARSKQHDAESFTCIQTLASPSRSLHNLFQNLTLFPWPLLYYIINYVKINKSVELQLRRARTDWSGCYQMAIHGALWLGKRLSLNLKFSFLIRISLHISSSYQIVLTWLGGPRSRSYTSGKICRVQPGIEPGASWMTYVCSKLFIMLCLRALFLVMSKMYKIRHKLSFRRYYIKKIKNLINIVDYYLFNWTACLV